MIVSFKYKFIFIKNYKVAGSSIENYLYPLLDDNDIVAPTRDFIGKNYIGDYDTESLIKNFDKDLQKKYINNRIAFFAHMPAWLVKERIGEVDFKNFYKFCFVRNPWDLVVSHFNWLNSPDNNLGIKTSFENIINDIKNVYSKNHQVFNYNRICNLDNTDLLVDRTCKFENLNMELQKVFNYLNIPFDGKLKIFKKVSKDRKDYKHYFDENQRTIIEKNFINEIKLMNYKF